MKEIAMQCNYVSPKARFMAIGRGVIAACVLVMQQAAEAQPLAAPLGNQIPILAQAANSIGIKRCYGAIAQISTRASSDSKKQDIVVDWDHRNPDDRPFFSLTAIEYPSAAAVLSLTAVGQPGGACSVLAERISSAAVACKEVARSELVGYHASPLVRAITVYNNPARPRETVTLVDAPPSCLIIRRQVEYDWPAIP